MGYPLPPPHLGPGLHLAVLGQSPLGLQGSVPQVLSPPPPASPLGWPGLSPHALRFKLSHRTFHTIQLVFQGSA